MFKHILIAAIAALPVMALGQTRLGVGPNAAIEAAVKSINPTAEITSARLTPLAGIVEVSIDGNVVYISTDGRYLIVGDLIDLRTRSNHTESARSSYREKIIKADPSANRIIYKATNEKQRIFVFTDITCSFCVMLHKRMAEYNALGITVEYFAWPRAGINSGDFVKMRNIWCAEDRKKAFDAAVAGTDARPVNCPSPIAAHIALGHQIGVEATPAIYDIAGQQLGGFLEPAQMAQALGIR